MGFAILVDHVVKMKETKKTDKYMDLASKLEKLWSMRLMVIPIIVCALRTVPKRLERELEESEISGRIKTIQITALLKLARILRKVLGPWEDLLSLRLQWKTISWCEKLARSIIVMILAIKMQTVAWQTEKMPQGNKRNRISTIHWPTHPHGQQNKIKNVVMA